MSQIAAVNDNMTLRTYKIFKTEFRLERYLLSVKNPRYRNALSQFRLSSHNLGIEIGRHCRPKKPVEERLCMYCNEGKIDDEMHMLFSGSFHTEERKEFTACIKIHIPDYDGDNTSSNLSLIFNARSSDVIKSTGKLIYRAFQKRKQIPKNTESV